MVSKTDQEMKTSADARDIELDALTELLNGGFIEIYTGPIPASPETPATGTLLATLEFSDPAYQPASGGQADSNNITEDTDAANTGAAGWFRCFKSDGVTAVCDGSIATSGADLNLNSTAIQAHSQVSITSLPIVLPQ